MAGRIAGIIGTGSLGTHLIRMINSRPDISKLPYQPRKFPLAVIGSVRTYKRERYLRDCYFIELFKDNKEVAKRANIVLLSVKPSQIKDVCQEIASHLDPNTAVISAAAAVPLDKLHEWLPNTKTVIRCMPNVACSIGSGVATYYSNSSDAFDVMHEVFVPNLILPVSSDKEMDTSTLISGCSPAFLAWYVDCLKLLGYSYLPPETLNKMITQTMIGTAEMLKRQSSEQIIRAVASPGGATEAALKSLNDNKVDELITEGIMVAKKRIDDISSML